MKDIKFPTKRASVAPTIAIATTPQAATTAEGSPDKPQEARKLTQLGVFNDGHVFKYTPHPKMPGQFVMYGPDSIPIAIVNNPDIADMLCEAARLLFMATNAAREEAKTETLAGPGKPLDGTV